MSINVSDLNNRLWAAADQLRANSKLRSSEYGPPVLGLIFLRYADQRFQAAHAELTGTARGAGSRRTIGKADYHARGVLYLPEKARFSSLLDLPEGANLGKAVNAAMKAVEDENPELLETLEREKLGLDWRKRQQTHAAVLITVQDTLDKLPRAYSREMYAAKCEAVYQHVFEAYAGVGRSIYGARPVRVTGRS